MGSSQLWWKCNIRYSAIDPEQHWVKYHVYEDNGRFHWYEEVDGEGWRGSRDRLPDGFITAEEAMRDCEVHNHLV